MKKVTKFSRWTNSRYFNNSSWPQDLEAPGELWPGTAPCKFPISAQTDCSPEKRRNSFLAQFAQCWPNITRTAVACEQSQTPVSEEEFTRMASRCVWHRWLHFAVAFSAGKYTDVYVLVLYSYYAYRILKIFRWLFICVWGREGKWKRRHGFTIQRRCHSFIIVRWWMYLYYESKGESTFFVSCLFCAARVRLDEKWVRERNFFPVLVDFTVGTCVYRTNSCTRTYRETHQTSEMALTRGVR